MISSYLGSGYGAITKNALEAVDKVTKLEGDQKGSILEPVYSGKTEAGIIDYLKNPENRSKVMLFWNI